MGSDATSEQPGWHDEAPEASHRRRRRAPGRVPWFRWLLVVASLAGLAWLNAQPGGLGRRLTSIKSSITGAVSTVTESRELDKATKSFNGWYDEQGQYPNYTQSQLDERSNDGWGAGMDVSWCTPRDVVLTSLTASGTMSRLLIDGKKVGDLQGRVQCPADLVNPLPWTR